MNNIAIIGCGNMGLIYANSFLRYKITTKENLLLVEKNTDRQRNLSAMNIGKVVTVTDTLIAHCNIVILAVKPQDFKDLAQDLKPCGFTANITMLQCDIKVSVTVTTLPIFMTDKLCCLSVFFSTSNKFSLLVILYLKKELAYVSPILPQPIIAMLFMCCIKSLVNKKRSAYKIISTPLRF